MQGGLSKAVWENRISGRKKKLTVQKYKGDFSPLTQKITVPKRKTRRRSQVRGTGGEELPLYLALDEKKENLSKESATMVWSAVQATIAQAVNQPGRSDLEGGRRRGGEGGTGSRSV